MDGDETCVVNIIVILSLLYWFISFVLFRNYVEVQDNFHETLSVISSLQLHRSLYNVMSSIESVI
jgi:hypothetical protein